jgi:hypothetical protein
MKKIILTIIFGIIVFSAISAQNNQKIQAHFSRFEFYWAIKHPLLVNKAYQATKLCLYLVDSIRLSKTIGIDEQGGQLDAFKHALWMALLVQKTDSLSALELGIAHEKGNYLQFKRKKTEDSICPDKAGSEMDLWNNNLGINIGLEQRQQNIQEIINNIIQAINNGELKIIKKDLQKNYLDENDQIILQNVDCLSWENNKTLVKSNYLPNK